MNRTGVARAQAFLAALRVSVHAPSKADEGAALFSSQRCTMCHSAADAAK